MSTKISFISPCFNEEGNVNKFYELVQKRMNMSSYDYEIVFIDDGSKDATFDRLKELYYNDKSHIKVISFLHNFGKEAAILAGLKNADGDYFCTIDSDCQHDPEYALEMAKILDKNEKLDMVAACPSNEKDPSSLAFFKKCFYNIINAISSVPFKQGASDFRVFRKCVRDAIVSMPEHNRFSKGIFSWVSPNFECTDYEVEVRMSGESKWNFWKLFKYAVEGICSFSHAPLLIPIGIGIFEFAIAFLLLIAQIIGGIAGLHFNFTLRWLIMLILVLTGMQSISTGIIGQYVSKIHTETMNRPQYIIKETLEER